MSVINHTISVNPRQQRGKEIATTNTLRMRGALWVVPSQAENDKGDKYLVDLTKDTPHCSCPDHEMRRVKCKHIYAVEYTMKRETEADGTCRLLNFIPIMKSPQT